jgi:hypothetical protein
MTTLELSFIHFEDLMKEMFHLNHKLLKYLELFNN